MRRRGSAGSNTAEDHIVLLDAADRRVATRVPAAADGTVDRAGTSDELITHLDKLAYRRGYQLVYSVGWALIGREKTPIRLLPGWTRVRG